jgi:hypothetical protein
LVERFDEVADVEHFEDRDVRETIDTFFARDDDLRDTSLPVCIARRGRARRARALGGG